MELTVKEVAELRGCSERYIQSLVHSQSLPHIEIMGENGRKKYKIPIEALSPAEQIKYYRSKGQVLPPQLQRQPKKGPAAPKPLEAYTIQQRGQINGWITLLKEWQQFRDTYPGRKSSADAAFVQEEQPGVSVKTLYRKWGAYQSQNWDGLIDKRGQWKKGGSNIPQEIKDIFLYTFLDERRLSVAKCMEATRLILMETQPELLPEFPSYPTFYRWSREYPAPISTLMRKGEKAFDDLYGIYADRFYDDMDSNDYWIADGHTIDVITQSGDGDGQRRRLTLSAFIDARSGIYVGWVITDHPSSDATLLALRKAVRRYGVPRRLYVDNGREYLCYDIGGNGHRTRTRKVQLKLPTPILSRLGIEMTNALPRNARAKLIEREFRNFTFLSQLFDTWCGSNPVEKPEKLKRNLKNGKIPTDSRLYEVLEDMIEGYFNLQPYGGKVAADRGKPRIEVYNEHIKAVRMAPEEELNLMMMRSSRLQTIGRNGVSVTISGERIYYFTDELLLMAGKKVFVRYDPEDLREVRVYDEEERFLTSAPLRTDIQLSYFASQEGVRQAMAVKRRYRKKVKGLGDAQREKIISQYGHINMLDLFVRAAHTAREGLLAPQKPQVYELIQPDRLRLETEANGTDGAPAVPIDRLKMIQNNERQG